MIGVITPSTESPQHDTLLPIITVNINELCQTRAAPLLFWPTAIPVGTVPAETGWSNPASNKELGIHRVLYIQVHFLS